MSSRRAESPPVDLDSSSKKLWRATIEQLEQQRTWAVSDLPLLERYVRAVQAERQAREDMAKSEDQLARRRLARGSTGQLVTHPLEAIRQKADADAHKYAEALLLSPAARKRTEVEAAKPAGKFGAALT